MLNFELPTFFPHRLIRGGNPQTIAGALLRGLPEPAGTTMDVVETTQGDSLALFSNQPGDYRRLDTSADQAGATDKPVPDRDGRQVLLLHGLAGCHGSSYSVRAAHGLLQAGHGVFRMDARGAGSGAKLARYHHHAGRIEDVQATVRHMTTCNPEMRITVVGFSLGANVLLKWLGSDEQQIPTNVDSAIAIAPPADLGKCAASLMTGFSRFYDGYFARLMIRRLRERRLLRPDMIDFPIQKKPEKLSQLDEALTVPAGGFASLTDYYDRCSSKDDISKIRIPTMIIVDELDPVIPIEMFSDIDSSPSVTVRRTRGGGHLGYIAGQNVAGQNADPDRYWLGWRIVDIVNRIEAQCV